MKKKIKSSTLNQDNNQVYSDIISNKVYGGDKDKLFSITIILLIVGALIIGFLFLMLWAFSQVI